MREKISRGTWGGLVASLLVGCSSPQSPVTSSYTPPSENQSSPSLETIHNPLAERAEIQPYGAEIYQKWIHGMLWEEPTNKGEAIRVMAYAESLKEAPLSEEYINMIADFYHVPATRLENAVKFGDAQVKWYRALREDYRAQSGKGDLALARENLLNKTKALERAHRAVSEVPDWMIESYYEAVIEEISRSKDNVN